MNETEDPATWNKTHLLQEVHRLGALRNALHEICEEWAGAECGEPVTAQEGYAIWLAKRMYQIAADATVATVPPNAGNQR